MLITSFQRPFLGVPSIHHSAGRVPPSGHGKGQDVPGGPQLERPHSDLSRKVSKQRHSPNSVLMLGGLPYVSRIPISFFFVHYFVAYVSRSNFVIKPFYLDPPASQRTASYPNLPGPKRFARSSAAVVGRLAGPGCAAVGLFEVVNLES